MLHCVSTNHAVIVETNFKAATWPSLTLAGENCAKKKKKKERVGFHRITDGVT